jgi:phosphoserine phosphatase
MPTAIFDFDGTLVYAPSSLAWAGGISLVHKMMVPPLYVFEKLTGSPAFQRSAFEWLVGQDVRPAIERVRGLPPVPGGLDYFRHLSKRGYRMVVMSFSPGIFVDAWLNEQGLSADVICPELDVERNEVVAVSQDDVTQAYLADPTHAKRKVVDMLNIRPAVSVGDNPKRDSLNGRYKDIRELEPGYRGRVRQLLANLDKVL